MEEYTIDFPGGARVDAHYGPFTIQTDQPLADGGQDLAPSPFVLFLASLGTCAGYFVLGFCRQRGLPMDGIRLVQQVTRDPATHRVSRVAIEIQLPEGFPAKYQDALIRAAAQCTVKKHLENPPQIDVTTAVTPVAGTGA